MRGVRGPVAVLSFVTLTVVTGCSAPPTLRSGDVEDQIATGLTEQVGGDFAVTCPTGVAAQAGTTFTCSVTDTTGGSTVTVTVTELDDSGRFDWRVEQRVGSATPVASPS